MLKRIACRIFWFRSSENRAYRSVKDRKALGNLRPPFHLDASPAARTFVAAYKAKYGQEAGGSAAWCYDAVRVFAEAMKKAPDLKPENLRQAILGIQKFPGAEGEYNFEGNGDGLDQYHVMQNDQGTITLLKTLRAAR